MGKHKVLVTNDDGVYAEGLHALVHELKKKFSVDVVAPLTNMSGMSHALTVSNPLRVKKLTLPDGTKAFGVGGTPTDCIILALGGPLKRKPALVISGINPGPNMCEDVFYSGTVSAAMEAAICGVPSFAVSISEREKINYSYAANFSAKFASHLIKIRETIPRGVFFNVNAPVSRPKGVAMTKQGTKSYVNHFQHLVTPKGREYFFMSTVAHKYDRVEHSDYAAVKSGKISVTPLRAGMTDYQWLEKMKKWKL